MATGLNSFTYSDALGAIWNNRYYAGSGVSVSINPDEFSTTTATIDYGTSIYQGNFGVSQIPQTMQSVNIGNYSFRIINGHLYYASPARGYELIGEGYEFPQELRNMTDAEMAQLKRLFLEEMRKYGIKPPTKIFKEDKSAEPAPFTLIVDKEAEKLQGAKIELAK